MELSCEIPANDLVDRVAGLSRAEKEEFWRLENRFNTYCSRAMHLSLLIFSIPYNSLFFVVRFEVDLYIYLFLQAINVAHFTFLVFTFFPSVHILCLFNFNLMRFFTKRFYHIRKTVKRLNATTKQVDDRKLTRLLYAHNRIHFDLIEMNILFRCFIGVNFVCCCVLGVLAVFVAINETIDLKVKSYLYAVSLALFTTAIAVPFKFASSLTTAVMLSLSLPFLPHLQLRLNLTERLISFSHQDQPDQKRI